MTAKQGAAILCEILGVMNKLPAGLEVLDFHADGIFLNGKIDIEEAAAALGVTPVERKPVEWDEDTVKALIAFFLAGDVMVYTYEKKT